jgi:ParB family chromosome partitioning protein
MTNLPLLKPQKASFSIVSGFRRIEATCASAQNTLYVRIIDAQVSEIVCAQIAIAENAQQRPLNPIEQSRSLVLLSRYHKSEDHLIAAARSLGLPYHPDLIHKLILLNDLPKPVQEFVINGIVSLPIALELNKLETNVAIELAHLFKIFKFGLNKQRELITIIQEIAIREGMSITEILASDAVLNILNDTHMDRGTKSIRLRSHLRGRRYPNLTQTQKVFQTGVKQLKLGHGVSLVPPKDFEGTLYTLTLSFNNLSTLDRQKIAIDKILQDPFLEQFLDT